MCVTAILVFSVTVSYEIMTTCNGIIGVALRKGKNVRYLCSHSSDVTRCHILDFAMQPG